MLRNVTILFITLAVSMTGFAQDAPSGDIGAQLKQIMEMLANQQKQIEMLQKQLQMQEQVIKKQEAQLSEQTSQIEEQKKVLEEQPTIDDTVEALVLYQTGAELEHIGRFEVRKREGKSYYQRAIQEYKTVLEKHPNTVQAGECAWRIGRIYHRYLKDYDKARDFYNLLIERYPAESHVDDARKNLADIKGK